MRNYGYVTVNPSDYAIVFKNGNIIKEGRGFRFYCTPRIQYVIIPGNVKNITFVADQTARKTKASKSAVSLSGRWAIPRRSIRTSTSMLRATPWSRSACS